MSRPRINLLRIEEELSEVHLRLIGVTIEHLSWQQFIKTYDKPGTLFYLDPPYYKAPYYTHNFELADYEELAQTLLGLKAHFILSINDHTEIRKVSRGFKIKQVNLSYSAAQNECTKAQELIITKQEDPAVHKNREVPWLDGWRLSSLSQAVSFFGIWRMRPAHCLFQLSKYGKFERNMVHL